MARAREREGLPNNESSQNTKKIQLALDDARTLAPTSPSEGASAEGHSFTTTQSPKRHYRLCPNQWRICSKGHLTRTPENPTSRHSLPFIHPSPALFDLSILQTHREPSENLCSPKQYRPRYRAFSSLDITFE